MAIYRTTLRGVIYGQTMNIVRYWNLAGTTPDFQLFADAWGEILEGTWDVAVHTECALNDIYISEALSGSLGFAVTPANFPLVGTLGATGGLPVHDAILAVYSRTTPEYPRQNRNRLGGGVESQIESGELTAGAVTTWTAVAEALSTSFAYGEDAAIASLWSDTYQQGGTVAARTVKADISTQRSRRQGVGS